MTPDTRLAIIQSFTDGVPRKVIAVRHGISISYVGRILKLAGLATRDPAEADCWTGQAERHYKRGDCLLCKKGKYRHPDWPGGACPACAGTGRYVDGIMKCREKGGQNDPNPN